MSSRRKSSVGGPGHDPFELDRLAEELASREGQHTTPRKPATKDNGDSSSIDLSQLQLQPLSHNNAYLTAPEWSVEEFLLSRAYTSLPDLRTELREYLATLKEELVRLINDDYEAFISLSTDLRGEGARLERMKWPLDAVRSNINHSRGQLQEIQSSVKEKLERRAALRDEKALLQLLLKISDSITRLESFLLISEPSDTSSSSLTIKSKEVYGEPIDERTKGNRAKHLLRTATEYVQLLYHSSKALAEHCTFVTEMQWRINRIKSSLTSDLESHFATTLSSLASNDKTKMEKAKQPEAERAKLMSDLTDCLRAYDMLGLWRDAEDVIRRELVREFAKKTIYPGCLSGPQSPLMPHTPFPQSSFKGAPQTASLHPRTPYTPFTAFPSKQGSFFTLATDVDAGIYLLDDSDSTLASLYNVILRFVARDIRPIMETADRVGVKRTHAEPSTNSVAKVVEASTDEASGEHGFDILANVVWAEVSRAITDDLGSIVFAVGKPEDFRKNFETTQAFVRSLEYLAPSLQSVSKMRAHPSFGAFEKRWQLPVYFQLRWKEIVSKVEEGLQSTSLTPSPIVKPVRKADFVLGQSVTIWNAICECWNADIYLRDLGHRFWRLMLQLIKRYRTWLDKNLPALEQSEKLMGSVTDKVNGTPSGTPRAATPSAGQGGQNTENSVDEENILYQDSNLIRDIREMNNRVMVLWKEEISSMLPFEASEGEESERPENVLTESLSSLTVFVPRLISQTESILIRRCCDTLTPVKTIAGQFRATSQKNLPTKPSSFVPLILRPVKLFFGTDSGEGPAKALREEYCVQISTNVVDAVSNRYMMHVTALRKNEESLRRLRMGKRSGFSFFGNSSSNTDEDSRDEERIRTQLILDVEAFGKDAESLGVDTSQSVAFKSLNYMVHTSDVPNP